MYLSFSKKKMGSLLLTGLIFNLFIITSCINGTPPSYDTTIKTTYTVYYTDNGSDSGLVPADNTDYLKGDIVTVLGNPHNLAKSSYNFTGWNTQPDGNGLNFAQGETFFIGSSDIILFARWSAGTVYTVSYSDNGAYTGVTPVDTTMYIAGMGVLIPGNTGTLVRPGYSFTGWNTQSGGSGITYTQGQYMTMGTSDVTLYAKWSMSTTYTVTYNSNSAGTGTVPVDSTNYETGKPVTAMGNTGNLRRAGYSFTGWNTESDGSGLTCTSGQTFSMGSENVVLYARWVTGYSVTYNPNGAGSGSVPVDPLYYPQGTSVTVLGNTALLKKSGYSFAGWNTKFDGTGSTFTQGQSFPMGTSNVTLYAVWTLNPGFTVTYNGNGSTGGVVPVDNTMYINGQSVTVAGNTGLLVKTGFVFLGWNTQADWSGISYTASGSFAMENGDIELYAMWGGSGSVDLTFNPGTGTDSEISSIAVQSDGRIIIAGDFTTYNGISRNRIARLNTNGTLDTTFDPGSGANNTIYALAVQSDGRIIIAGDFTTYNGISRNRIARLNSNGTLDMTFDTGSGADNSIYCVAIQDDGKIIAGGIFTKYKGSDSNNLARIDTGGNYDSSFDMSNGPDNSVNTIAIQPDGRIIAAGSFQNCGGDARNRIARFEDDGTLDTTFDPGSGADDEIYSSALQADGKIVIGGIFSNYAGSDNYLARSSSDGTRDTGFSSAGAGSDYEICSIAIQSDGKILIGGNFEHYNSVVCNYLTRLNSDGTPDAGFKTENGADSTVSCIAIQTDGNIIVAGSFTTYNGISRNFISRVLK